MKRDGTIKLPYYSRIIETESHLLRYLGFLTLYDEFVMQHKPRSTWTQTANLTTGNLGVSKGEKR